MNALHLGHHFLVDGQAPGGVHQQHVHELAAGILQRPGRNGLGRLAGLGVMKLHLDLLGQGAQLFDGRGTVYVAAHHHDFLVFPFPQQLRQLGGGGGFTRALQAGHQHHGRGLRPEVQLPGAAAQDFDQLVLDHLDEGLPGAEAFVHLLANGPLFDALGKTAHHRQGHVGLQQRHPDVSQGISDVVLGNSRLAADLFECVGKPVAEIFEHGDVVWPSWRAILDELRVHRHPKRDKPEANAVVTGPGVSG